MCSVELILNGKSVSEWIEEETCAICEILLLVFKLGPKQWQYWHHWQGAWMQRASSFCMNSSCGRRLHVADRRQTRGRHAQQTRGRRCVPPGGEQKEPADKKEKLSKITYNLQQSSSRNSNTPKSLVQDGSFQTLIWMCLEGKFQPRDYIKSNFLWLPLVSAAQLDYKGELITRLQKTNSLSPKKCFMWFKCWYDNQELCGSPNLKTITGKKQGREFIGCPAWQTPFVWSQAAAADT